MKKNQKNNKYFDDRKEIYMKVVNNDDLYTPLIDSLIFMEIQIDELRKLPQIHVNPRNKSIQKRTEASRLLKEVRQQYSNDFKIIQKVKTGESGEDELFKWLKNNNEWND